MSKKGLELLTQDVHTRLEKIVFHFEERERLRTELENYTVQDYKPESSRKKDLERSIFRCTSEDINTLYELVHLADNVTSLLRKTKGAVSHIKEIEKDVYFRMAANFVNSHKHGSRGRNQKSAYIAFHQEFFLKAKDGSEADQLLQIKPVINFDGNLKTAEELIRKLIPMWLQFLVNHTEVGVTSLESTLQEQLKKEKSLSTYAAEVAGIDDLAKKDAEERKKLDI